MAAHRKYAWEEWFGRPETTLVRGVHYDCSQSTMCQTIRNNGSERGLHVRLTDKGTAVCIEVIRSAKRDSAGGTTKYSWNEWLSGDLLMLEKSVVDADGTVTDKRDYDVDTDVMLPMIKTTARRRYKVVQISRLDPDGNKLQDALIIQARNMTAEERVAENIKRAEKKAARAGIGGNEQAHAGG